MSEVSLINGHIDGAETCVCCGRVIPEGSQVCVICGKTEPKDIEQLLEIAINAIEKQIPKKPVLDAIFPSGVKWYLCPACNHNGIEKVGGYCHNCGQALDWSDTE